MGLSAPMIYVVAGSNGAGKSTLAMRYLPKYAGPVEFINADLIAQGLSPLAPEAGAVRAGRLVLARVEELRRAKQSFALETTLAGRSYARTLQLLRAGGYSVSMFYLWIPSTHLAIERIRGRVRAGGHNIPSKVVKRRFGRTLSNLFHVYYDLVDHLLLFDNSGIRPRMVAEKNGRDLLVHEWPLYNRILQDAEKHAKDQDNAQ